MNNEHFNGDSNLLEVIEVGAQYEEEHYWTGQSANCRIAHAKKWLSETPHTVVTINDYFSLPSSWDSKLILKLITCAFMSQNED